MTTPKKILLIGGITGIFVALLVFLPGELKSKFLSSSVSDTGISTSTESPTETLIPTNTEASTDITSPSTTENTTEMVIPSSTESSSNTEVPSTTESPSETQIPSSTESPTDTGVPSSTESPSSTEIVFTLPEIKTTAISNRTQTTALSGVNIISNGGSPITQRGITWSTSDNPTISLSTKTVGGSGALTGLSANTTYFVRAYATNSTGTAYGDTVKFTTPKNPITATLVVTGTARVGESMIASFAPAGTTATYQWQKSDTDTGVYTNITSETNAQYIFKEDDLNKYFRVVAIGSGNYTGSVISHASGKVVAALDTTPPTIGDVTSSKSNGAYNTGVKIPITIEFSEPVIVTGVPELILETGVVNRSARYTGGSGTNILTFEYTVTDTDISSDLNYIQTNALSLPTGASIRDTSNNNASLVLPTGQRSLSGNKNITIDTTRPATPTHPTVVSKTGISTFSGGTFVDAGNNREITFTVSCLIGGNVTLYNDVQTLATIGCSSTPVNIPVTLAQTAALYDINSVVTNAAGTPSNKSASTIVMKRDSTVSATPGTPDLVNTYDKGTSSTDNLTSETQPRFTLTCTSGSTVNLYDNTTLIGTGSCIANTAQIIPLQPLSSGVHILTAKQSINGTTSSPSGNLTLTIDTAPLTVTLARASEQSEPAISSTIKFTATFSRPIDTNSFICSDITVTNGSCKNIQLLSGNTYTITLTATGSGKVEISIPAGQIKNSAGNLNTKSTGINTINYTQLNSAGNKNIDGQCGALKEFYASKPNPQSLDSQKLCSQGSVVRVVYNAKQKEWSYTCRGVNNGVNSVCRVALAKALNSAPDSVDSCMIKEGTELPLDTCTMGNKNNMFNFQSYLACLNIVAPKKSCKDAGCTLNAKRQEFVYIIDRIRGIPLGDTGYACQNLFKDTPKGWICEAAEKARIAGLVSDKNTSFRGTDTLTRAEAYAMALMSVCIKPDTASKNWQTNIINTAREYKFTNRTVADFEPRRPISRGETYALAVNMIEWKTKNPDKCGQLPESLICEK